MSRKEKLYGNSRSVPILKTTPQLISWLKRAKLRKYVFFHIDKNTMPSDIVDLLTEKGSRKSASHYAQVSRAIAELELQGLVKCLNSKEKTGRLYELTKQGMDVKKEI